MSAPAERATGAGGTGVAGALTAGRPAGAVAALALVALIVALDVVEGPKTQFVGLLVAAPILAASFVPALPTAAVGLVALAAGAGYGAYRDVATTAPQLVRLFAIAVATAMATVAASLRVRRERRLVEVTGVAEVAQQTVLRPLPPDVGGLRIAVRYVSASAQARIGGDLYEALDTDHGVRVLVGDVRGKGLDAVRLASQVLGGFRHVAYGCASLDEVVAELDLSVRRASSDEDFVTAVVVEVGDGGRARVLNCGHPAPLLLSAGVATLLEPAEPSPPLGLYPQPTLLEVTLGPGDRLLLYTDGLAEARAAGAFFPLLDAAPGTLGEGGLEDGLDALRRALDRHVGGRLDDDVALVVIEGPPVPTAASRPTTVDATTRDGCTPGDGPRPGVPASASGATPG